MTKQSVVDDMAENGKMSKAEAGRAFDQTFESLTRVIEGSALGTPVVVPGFGTFKREMTTRTQARNPRTGEALAITPRPKTKFTETRSR